MYACTAAKAFLGDEYQTWDANDHTEYQGLTSFATALVPELALTRHVPGFKVIHCPSRNVIDPPDKCPFVALSYVWGKGDAQIRPYPTTIADSIAMCLALGFDYLWVDRYCIDQSNGDEKTYQVVRMDQIYSQASLTIIAAAGESPDYGLPGVKDTSRQRQRCVQLKDCRVVEIYPCARDKLCHSDWATRAWTYQEGFLSARRLIFDSCQVSLVCGCAFFAESITHEFRHDRVNKHLNFTPSFLNVAEATPILRERVAVGQTIEHYTRKRLSSDRDSLRAALGILNSFHSHQISVHLWGVTFQNRPGKRMRLNWSHPKPARCRPNFPSWSWAGWEGPVFNREIGPLLEHPSETMIEPHLKIKVKADDQGWVSIRTYLAEKHEQVHGYVKEEDVPRLLELTSRCAAFHFFKGTPFTLAKSVYSSQVQPGETCRGVSGEELHDDLYALLPLSNGIFRIHRILLDCEKTEIGRHEDCVVLLTESIDRKPYEDIVPDEDMELDEYDMRMWQRRRTRSDLGWSAIHLLLKPTGDRYERIGLVTSKFPEFQDHELLCDEIGDGVKVTDMMRIRDELLDPLWVERADVRTVVVE